MTDKLTSEQQKELTQNILNLKNELEHRFKQIEKIYSNPNHTIGDGVDALYTIYHAWNSDAYSTLETFIKEIRGY